jgi:hypothetical protein
MWKYYDFDANWDAFYDVWKTPRVQDVLKVSVGCYCGQENADRIDKLWTLTNNNYWESRKRRLAKDHIHSNGLYNKFAYTWKNINAFGTPTKEQFYALYGKDIEKEMEPKPGTIDNLIIADNSNIIANPLLVVADCLFPNSTVWQTWDYDECVFTLVNEEHLIFDLTRYFLNTREKIYKTNPEYIIGNIARTMYSQMHQGYDYGNGY